MKKILLFVVLSMMCATVSAGTRIWLGVKGGISMSAMSFADDAFSTSSEMGYFIGPSVRMSLPVGGLGLDASLLYEYREAGVRDVVNNDLFVKEKNFAVPVNLRYDFNRTGDVGFFVSAGPQFNFSVGGGRDYSPISAGWSPKDFSLGFNLGVGALFMKHLQFGVCYSMACGSSGEIVTGGSDRMIFSAHSNVWSISCSYYF